MRSYAYHTLSTDLLDWDVNVMSSVRHIPTVPFRHAQSEIENSRT